MIKALLKKQLMSVFSWVYRDNKKQRSRSVKGVVGTVLVYLLLFAFLGVMFYLVADLLCQPLTAGGFGWLYWCLMGSLSLFLGAFGSVFNTYASLYRAGDNDFLLSLPIPVHYILPIRLSGTYLTGLMYELIVAVPALLVWFLQVPQSGLGVLFSLLIPLLLSVLILVISILLGWIVALISGKLKHKNFLTVAVSLLFFGAYYFFSSQASVVLQAILEHPETVGERLRGPLYLLYHMGLAAEGRVLSMLFFTAVVAVLFVVSYAVLAHGFLKMATANNGEAKRYYKAKPVAQRSVEAALFHKEWCRFKGSAVYMLNCGLGMVLLPAAAVLLWWKADAFIEIIRQEMLRPYVPLAAAVVVAMLTTMNDMAAPSVSLEGKNLWLLQVMPVSARSVLLAKWRFQFYPTVLAAVPLIAVLEWLLCPSWGFAVLFPLFVVLFIAASAAAGLAVNLKRPNLNWIAETVPVKQDISIAVALFGGWVVLGLLAAGYIGLYRWISPLWYLLGCCVLLALLAAALLRWLTTRGARILETLS